MEAFSALLLGVTIGAFPPDHHAFLGKPELVAKLRVSPSHFHKLNGNELGADVFLAQVVILHWATSWFTGINKAGILLAGNSKGRIEDHLVITGLSLMQLRRFD